MGFRVTNTRRFEQGNSFSLNGAISSTRQRLSPDGHFIVDRLPDHPNVAIAAGFSEHGFKFTSVIGETLADLITHSRTELPIDFLGLKRFA